MLLGFVLLLAAAGPTFATTGHRYAGQFSSPGFGFGELFFPSGLAVRQSTGDVYVVDSANGRVQRFDATTGGFISSFNGSATPAGGFGFPVGGIAIDQSSGEVYVVDSSNNAVDLFSATGSYLSQLDATATPASAFSFPSAVAVDPSDGTVYVSDTNNNVVDVFDNTGAFVTSFDGSSAGDGPFVAPTGLAVDSSHDVYVLDSGKGRVEKYTAQGAAFTSIFDSTSPTALAVDPSSSEVYVAENGPSGVQVSEFTSSGTAISTFGPPHIAGTSGIGVNATTGTLYVADQASSVISSFIAFIAPTVTTGAASGIEATEATLAGTINPEGVKASYRFEYGATTSYGNTSPQPDTEAGEGNSDVEASTTLTGLAPGTTYHYRLLGTNALGSSAGADQTFTTSPAQVLVDVNRPSASSITPNGATLNDGLNPNGADTTYRFEYGTTTSYGSVTPDGDAGSTPGEVPVSTPITGLQAGVIYHFRVVAENGVGGQVQGADAIFTTAAATALSASSVTASSAMVHGAVIPGVAIPGIYEGLARYTFEYGTDTSYGKTSFTGTVGEGSNEVPVSALLSNLAPGTTYHYRLHTITNTFYIAIDTHSDDATFTTVAAPAVGTATVTELTPTTATLNVTVDTHGAAGTATFAVTSTERAYGTTTAPIALAATGAPQSIAIPITNLPSGISYRVIASATVAGVTAWGGQGEFSTPQSPPFAPPTPPLAITANPYGCTTPHLDPCGVASNTIGIAVAQTNNKIVITHVTSRGASVTLTVKTPAAGKLRVAAANITSVSTTTSRASTTKLTVHLNKAGRKALAKARGRLQVRLRVTYIPTGGSSSTTTRTITFKRGGTR